MEQKKIVDNFSEKFSCTYSGMILEHKNEKLSIKKNARYLENDYYNYLNELSLNFYNSNSYFEILMLQHVFINRMYDRYAFKMQNMNK